MSWHPGMARAALLTATSWTGRPWSRMSTSATPGTGDRKSTRLNSSHLVISYAVFCLKKKNPRSGDDSYLELGPHCFLALRVIVFLPLGAMLPHIIVVCDFGSGPASALKLTRPRAHGT